MSEFNHTKYAYLSGLLIFALISTGLILNFLAPLIGITRPISSPTTTVVTSLAAFALLWMLFKHFPKPHNYHLLLILPLLTAFGGLWVNRGGSNIILIIGVIACVATGLWLMFKGKVKTETYALALWSMALALIYAGTLFSFTPIGYDTIAENFYSNLTIQEGLWFYDRPTNINMALSVTILSPILATGLNLSVAMLSKIIYPLFWALTPMILFLAFRGTFGDRWAFIASIITMAIFIQDMNIRVQFGMFFVALIVLVLLDRDIATRTRVALFTLFSLGLVGSYYTINLLYIAYIGIGIGIPLLCFTVYRVFKSHTRYKEGVALLVAIIVVIGVIFAWFNFASGASMVKTTERITQEQVVYLEEAQSLKDVVIPETQISEIVQPAPRIEIREQLIYIALGLDFAKASGGGKIFRLVQYLLQILIVAGIIRLVFQRGKDEYSWRFTGICLVAVGMLLACIALPTLSGNWEAIKFYIFAMLILPPVAIIGAETLIQRRWQIIPVVLIATVYLAFMSGLAFEVTKSTAYNQLDMPSSEALSGQRVDAKVIRYPDSKAIEWLRPRIECGDLIYGDHYAKLFLNTIRYDVARDITLNRAIPDNAYIYLRHWNVKENNLVILESNKEFIYFNRYNLADVKPLQEAIVGREIIYSSQQVIIYNPLKEN